MIMSCNFQKKKYLLNYYLFIYLFIYFPSKLNNRFHNLKFPKLLLLL
ncbi:MAG: hypothetical protein N7Q72_03935 [Spiroplasma sp. Tabriz.8]|nr:hypothetical protein [Spiroplasma sp. Tabriz.8]